MEAADKGGNDLITGIKQDARAEAEKILDDAQRIIGERRAASENQAEAILKDAKKKADEQIKAIRRNTASAIAVETHRISLRVRDQIIRTVLDRIKENLKCMIEKPEYRQVLVGWIVEAAIGLNVPEAEVSVSALETKAFDDSILSEAEVKVRELTGRKVSLKKSPGDPPLAQGIVLKAANKPIIFNNQVQTRLLRYQSEIRKLIYKQMFCD